MTRVLLDLNVLLDVILDRKPGVLAAARLWAVLELGGGQGFIPAHGVTTVFDILEKARGATFARRAVEQLLQVFDLPGDFRTTANVRGWRPSL